ncbi:integrin alpha [Streptomyces sp. A5-4]|uniref:integrin alpha n=1 Tax=Streptomyces sp. A5-4 TaxID=3384771 RepID=UPI003DA84F90
MPTAQHRAPIAGRPCTGVPGAPPTGGALLAYYLFDGGSGGAGRADRRWPVRGAGRGRPASARGLTGASSWLEAESPIAGQEYGTGLAAADVDADGRPELAQVTGVDAVYGHDFGDDRNPANPEFLYGVPTEEGFRPTGLTAGDYDKDGYEDLVVLGTEPQLEYVQSRSVLLRGGADGITMDRMFSGGTSGASADINKDGYPDLVVGDPRVLEHGEYDLSPGSVQVRYGSEDGLFGASGEDRPQIFEQSKDGIPGSSEVGDDFGSDVSLGDVNGDGYPDLAVGSRGESIGDREKAGAVWLLRGSARGLTAAGVKDINQDTAGVPGVAEAGDAFGGQVRLIDANRDGRAELVVGAPGENSPEGHVWVFPGSASGPATAGSWTFGAAALGAPQHSAHFGATLGK